MCSDYIVEKPVIGTVAVFVASKRKTAAGKGKGASSKAVETYYRVNLPGHWTQNNRITKDTELSISRSDGYILLATPDVGSGWTPKSYEIRITDYLEQSDEDKPLSEILPTLVPVLQLDLMRIFTTGHSRVKIYGSRYAAILFHELEKISKQINSVLRVDGLMSVQYAEKSNVVTLSMDSDKEETEFYYNFPKVTQAIANCHNSCLAELVNSITSGKEGQIAYYESALDVLWFFGIRQIHRAGTVGFFCGVRPTVLHATFLGVLYKVLERNTDHMRSLWHAVLELREHAKAEDYAKISYFFAAKLRELHRCYSDVLKEAAITGTGNSVSPSSLKGIIETCDSLRSEIGETQSEPLTEPFGKKSAEFLTLLSKEKGPDFISAWLDLQNLARNLRTIAISLHVLTRSQE